jgi:hypothetical protein
MLTQYFVEDSETRTVFFAQGLPFVTPDRTLAQFVTWSLNRQKPDRFVLKKFTPPAKSTRLAVPYVSQWGDSANQRSGDCGPACIAMLARYVTGKSPTVDRAADACGQPATGPGASYTDHAQLRKGAAFYGFTLQTRSKYSPPPLTIQLLKEKIDAGRPSIALIHYGVLRDLTNPITGIVHNLDQKYARGHWIVFTGYDDEGVYIHDPDFWGQRVNDGDSRLVPESAFTEALNATAPGCSVGNQGLIITGGIG